MARLNANLAAIEVVRALRAESRAATPAEQEILAGWSGWGAVSAVFEEKPGESRAFTEGRQQLKALLTEKEYAAARRNTINAHYTGTALAQAIWDGLAAFGFSGGRVLEPGCGSGNFIGLAPLGTAMVGIELDPVTAHVAAALYPHVQIRNESFADTHLPEGSFDAAVGNVPFGQIHPTDPQYNPGRAHPIHTYFVLKSAALVRPGGWIALITSRYTLDGTGEEAVAARRKLAGLGELAAAVRLPDAVHRRTAGTDVVTDVLVIRRFEDGEQPPPGEPAWIQTVPVDVGGAQIPVNRHFADNPGMVLGDLAAGGARRADDLQVIAPVGTDVAAGLAQALAGAAAGRAAPAPRPATPSPVTGRPPEGYQQARADGTFTRMTGRFFEPFDPPGGPAGQAELRALLGLRDAAIALLDAELATTEDAGLVDDLRADLNTRYDAYVAAYGPVNRYTPQVKIRSTPEGRALREQLLAEGQARFTGGKLEISDPAVRDQLIADGHATVTEMGELRFGRTRAAHDERHRLLDSGQARALGGTFTLTETGRARVLENAADLQDAVTIIRSRPSQGGFRNDPFAVRVLALEKYDPETGTARKNDIMRHRVLLPRPAVEHAEEPKEALAICMDRHAQVRLDVIAALLGAASEQDARDQLGTLVYHDPAEGRLVPAQEYLSGDVRVKLRQAAAAAADDPAYQANVAALTEVIPADLGPAEIEARLGAVFITPTEVQQFLRETLADSAVTVTLAKNGTWSVDGGDRHSVAAILTWGTKDRSAQALAEHLLNRRGPVEVTRTDSEGRTWTDEEATQAAREKQAELSDRFAGWAWEDLDRAGEICRRYNDAFNSIVLRSYDEVQLSLPGVNRDISLYWWQKAAIARMIYEPTAGLFHDMGAGKTLEQIIGVMEQKRLGLIRKPVICVKNHLLDQFRDEFLWAYPQARILCADTPDLEGEGRRQFIARCAAENPDAIIMTRGAFEAIPLTPEGHEAYLDYMKQMFTVHAEAVTDSVKDEETLLSEFEQKLREYFDPDAQEDEDEEQDEGPGRKRRKRKIEQDPAMCWEQMGIDYVCVDESQDYNNLWVPSDEPGMAIGFVHRSIDLEMKLHAIRRRYGSRAGALATGTPVTNKIAQFYVLQRYLRPERLQVAGFAGYAPWAATYTEPEQRLEMKADGGFGLVTRMRLINFPELLLELHYFGDFKDADDIGLQRPAIRGGRPEIRGNPAVTELADYQSTLPERYRKAKGGKKHKGDDTVVAVIGDGFRAAQDLRLIKANHGEKPRLTDEPQKIDHIADDVYTEWLAHRDDIYPGEDGQPDPVTGSLQLVFCNEGVPSADWNLYDELRNLLIERGMPRAAVRFIHDATDARKKAALFAACNAGHVAVLIGSTEKMGVGTNVQRRCIGVHHVHPQWRPDYDAQEDARARRPGNLNAEVFIKKWITEGSFDTIRAQACERKSVFLRVIKHRDTSVRSIEAPGDDTVSYAEIAAVGAGEPRLIQKAQLESELQQLARAQRRHLSNQNALKVAEQQARASITAAEQTIRDIDAAVGRVIPTAGDAFSMTVGGTAFTARREAGDHLIACLRDARARVPAGECHTTAVGTIGGFQLTADLAHGGREHTIVVQLADLPGGVVRLDHRKLPAGIGLVTRLENRLTGLDKLRLEQQAVLDRQRQEITRAQAAIGVPFPQQDAMLAAKKALDDLVTELRGDKNNKDGAKADPAAAAAGSAGLRHDVNRDIRPAAGTRPARTGGPDSATGRSGSAPGDGAPYGEESAAPAARRPGTADTSMPASGLSGLAARDTGLGRDVGAALAEHSVAKSTVPDPGHPDQYQGAASEPADDPAVGLVIEHHQQGTLVHGTEKNDQELRRLLRKQGFRWSDNLNAWYLPRPWTFSTRNQRVTGLTASLRQARRSFTMRGQPPAPGAGAEGDSPPEPVPAGEPYTDLRQAQDDHSAAVYDYWELARTPAGNNVMSTRQPGARPDAVALDAAYHAVHVSWQQAFAGDPHEVADRFTAWTQAASTLSRNLAAEQHRAPKFRQTLDTFIRSATRLASRAQATSEDPATWARVFAGIPGDVPDTPPETAIPDPAQPAAGSPEPGAAPAGNQQGGRDSDEPGHTTAPAADDDTAAPSPAPPADAAPALPAACRSPADLRQLAAACGLSIDTESAGARATQLTVVHDGGRTVLLHDDISGTSAGGYQLDPGEVPAYLAAYARHPQLPPRCLADLVRQDPAAPGILTLAGAREIAARHDLEIRIRRARGQAYITFCEPGTVGPPVLSYPAGTGTACHGPCTVPVAAINGYLLSYRDSVPAAMFMAPAAAPQDWAGRVAQLTPHLVDGGGYFIRDTRDHLRAALTAARDGNTDEASRLLGQAETVTPPLTLTPERQAELLAVIGEHAARYGYTDDPAGYMARAMPPVLDASDREWHWVRTYIADHPDVRERTDQDGPTTDAGQPDDDRQAAAGKSRQAKTALENGDCEQALALLDEAELLYSDHGISWEAARDQVRGAMRQAASPRPQGQDSPGSPAPRASSHAGTADTAPDVEPAPATPDGHYEARIAGHPWDYQAWPATPEGRASADQHARSRSARSDHVWEVCRVPAASAGEPAVVCRYRHGRLQLDLATLQPATTGKDAGTMASPAAPAAHDLRDTDGLPEGTQPVPAHAAWGGNLRPERLLYADGTPLTIRGQGEDADQVLPAIAVGAILAGSDYVSGRLQVVRWEDGGYGIVHPALASPRDIDAYTGLSDRDRARWEAFDLAEAWPTTTAGLPPHLVDAGDTLQVERGPRSHTMDLREVQSIRPGSGTYAGGLEFKVTGVRSPLFYPERSTVPVCIPQEHPSLPTALQAATMTGPGRQETSPQQPRPDTRDDGVPAPASTGRPAGPPDPAPALTSQATAAEPGSQQSRPASAALGQGQPASAGSAARPRADTGPEPVTSGSQARGYAARMADLRISEDGSRRSTRRTWGLAITHPSGRSPDCRPTVLTADLRCSHDRREACQCAGSNLLYRGACRGCDWEGEIRLRENHATEDAHDHAFPGWRDLPAVQALPRTAKALAQWKQDVTRIYPPSWLERGGPVRTIRQSGADRHHPMPELPGYDIAADPAQRAATPGSRALADHPSPAPPVGTPMAATAAPSVRPPQDVPPDRTPEVTSPGADAARPGQPPVATSLRAGAQTPAGSMAETPATATARPSGPASPADGMPGGAGTAAAPDAAAAAKPSDGDEIPAHGAAAGSPQQSPRPSRADDAPAAGKAKAGEAMAAARSATGQVAGVTGAAAPSPPSGEPPPVPVTNSDLARALHHLHGWEFAQLISQVHEPGRAGSRTGRQHGDPGAGARESLDWDASGLRIAISGPGVRRYSQLSWPQIEHWIDAGMTPARRGLIVTASQLRSFCQSHRQELIAAGRCDPDAAVSELAQIRDDAISTVIAAALRTRGAAAPVPPADPGTPGYHTAAMITRPDPDAGKDENTALERLARLRAAVADPQPVTAAEVRAAIRRWIGDQLPDHVRALGNPAKMRAWIDDQVTDRVGRPAPVTYDNPGAPGGRWYSASPEGLLTGAGGDDRAETLIRWEEIPVWTQPGITTSLRDRLLSADDTCRKGFRRRLTAAVHPRSGVDAPNGQEDEQSARHLREAITAAWAAIDAAPAPGPAQLERARRTFRDTSSVQETLFTGTEPAQQHDDASRVAGQAAAGARLSAQASPGPSAPPADSNDTPATAEATAVSTPAAPARQQHADAMVPPVADGTPRHAQHPPAQAPRSQSGTPLSDDDICLGLRRLPPMVFAELLGGIGTGRSMDPAIRQLAPYSGERAPGEPGGGARETVTASPTGVRIQVDAADGTRAGLLTWPEAARWVQPGLTPARRQIIEQATRNGLRFAMAHASFRGIGEAALAADAEQELRNLAVGAVTAMLEDARAARTGQPCPGGQPGHGDGEVAALERIADLAAALPVRPPQPRTTVWQVKAGDIIGHPGYRLQPFLVSAPPRDRAGQIEITGRLTDPADGEPAGQITLTLTRAGRPDPVVYLVPPPTRSLRSLPGRTTTTEGHPDQDHTRADDPRPGDIAQPAARHEQPPATAQRPHPGPAGTHGTSSTATPGMTPGTATPGPSRVNSTGQPPGNTPLIQEDTMPPAVSATSLPPEGTAPADRPAPAAGPAPAAWKLVAGPAPASPDSQPADDKRLLHELDHVLAAITERRRAAAALPGTDGTSFADIRAAFMVLRHALDLPGPASDGDGARQPAAVPDAARHASPPPGAAQDAPAVPHGDFSDIRAAFASLRDVLGLPATAGHARPTAPRPDAPAGPDAGRLLDQAAAEAHACARWYRDTPEWQRMSRIGRAARELLTAIREAAGDYWAEIRLDIRVRGFARTLAARVSLAVSGASHLLAGRLERAGHRDTRPWRAAWRLHQATATFANRVMNYTPPGSPARMDDARRIIDDLGHGARRPGGPEPSRAASPPGRDTRTSSAVALGRECFPVLVSRANTRPGAAPTARTPAPPRPHQAPAAARR